MAGLEPAIREADQRKVQWTFRRSNARAAGNVPLA
jgi:hypothetical protein